MAGPAGKLDSVFEHYVDERTGARIFNLTPGQAIDHVVYQTHPMWTADMAYLLFHSDRSGNGMRPHALDLATGVIRGITEAGCTASTMTWKGGDLFFLAGRDLYVVNVAGAFKNEARPRLAATLPPECLEVRGTITVDAREDAFYAGALFEEDKRWGILALDIASGAWRKVVEVDFKVGHLQANPFVTGEIMFCHETGGDAPQRTWFVKADGTGLTPFYKETYGEWVTHEVWWAKDEIVFTIWPYDDAHKQQPHGIACATRTAGPQGKMDVIAQYPAWHTHGSPDGNWAMGDDFDRNIWLVNVAAKERRLLSQGHLGEGFKTHPHGSFTPRNRAVVFTSSRNGTEDIFLAEIPDWSSLPLA